MTDVPPAPDAEPSTETASPAHWPQMTGQAVSDFIGFSPTMLRKLENQDFVERLASGKFDGGAALLGYIRWLKDDARRNNKTEGAKRKEAAQALKVEIDNAKALHELVDFDTIELSFSEIFTLLRSEFDALPAGVTRDLDLRAAMETYINGVFDRCRSRFEAEVKALQSGRPMLDGEESGES